MELINLTPHDIAIHANAPGGGVYVVFVPPSGRVARLDEEYRVITELVLSGEAWVAVGRPRYGAILGLPEPKPGVLYIASARVAEAAAGLGRRDVVAPDTSPGSAIRDPDGQIVGCRRLITFAERVDA